MEQPSKETIVRAWFENLSEEIKITLIPLFKENPPSYEEMEHLFDFVVSLTK